VPLLELLGQSVGIVGEDPSQANLVKLIGNFMLSVIIETLVSGARRIANSAP
jgi:3-hydroxyisobutyrate dehydrogenase-like beta-hydroxyacid dehydrogenase